MAKAKAGNLNTGVFNEINEFRVNFGLDEVSSDKSLVKAAGLQASWNGWATKHKVQYLDHTISTAWLLDNFPNLLWDRLRGTFPDGLPDLLSSHDVARLCGWEGGVVRDIGYLGKARANLPTIGWDGSPRHAAIMYGDYDTCGVGSEPASGGNTWIVALFGSLV